MHFILDFGYSAFLSWDFGYKMEFTHKSLINNIIL